MPSHKSSTAAISSSNVTSRFTRSSSAAAKSCEIGLWRLAAHRISEIFGVRLNKRLHGKLTTVIDQIEHGHHVFRAYWKNGFDQGEAAWLTLSSDKVCGSSSLRAKTV